MEPLENIKSLILSGEIDAALRDLEQFIATTDSPLSKSEAYYLRGNAYRKQANWQQALNNYQQAIELDAESPAVQAKKMLLSILEFYHKDMFNQ